MRVGFGYDAHPLIAGRPLVLAGVSVPFERGLDGYSDGDVVAHAVIDAILGACALGDCGTAFPAGDPRYKGVRSLDLVERALAKVRSAGQMVGNLDCTIAAENPKLQPFIEEMRKNIAGALGVNVDQVSIKAKRTEGLGFEGEGRGIAAYAVAMVVAADAKGNG
jgi:2-C-methyl-D-erythritol 2,4-cyclodiphosphate synthase